MPSTGQIVGWDAGRLVIAEAPHGTTTRASRQTATINLDELERPPGRDTARIGDLVHRGPTGAWRLGTTADWPNEDQP